MRRHGSLLFALSALAAGAACHGSPNGPSRLAGGWTARGSGHTGLAYHLAITPTGTTISGTACAADGGITMFRNAPVTGRDRLVSFVVTAAAAGPCCAHLVGASFSGRQDGTGDIVGTLSNGADLRFTRGGSAGC